MDTPNLKLIAITSFFIALGIISFALFVGSNFQTDRMLKLESDLKTMNARMLDLENMEALSTLSNDSCVYLEKQLIDMREQLEDIASQAIAMEQDLKTNTEEYKSLKKNLMATRMRYWILAERMKDTCHSNMTTVLYFYATKTKCEDCLRQGIILEHLNSKLGNILMISPVDMDEDLYTINIMKAVYNVTYAPTMIFDREKVFRGLTSEDEILSYLCEKYNNTLQLCPSSEAH